MNSWLQSMTQWTQWLMGESPLPDGRSKAMLAGTVASVAAIAVGVPAIIPSGPTASATSHLPYSANPDAGSSQYTVPTSTVAPSSVVAAGGTTSSTVSPYYSQADPLATGRTARHGGRKHERGASRRTGAGSHTRSSGSSPSTTVPGPSIVAAPLVPSTAPLEVTQPTATASTPSTLIPIDPVPALVAPTTPPPAPFTTGAQAFVGSALITWKPPAGSTATGYDVFIGLTPGAESPVPVNGAVPVVGTSYLATGLTAGRVYYVTVRSRTAGASSPASNEVSAIPFDVYTPVGRLTGPVISLASTADGSGYWLAAANGAVSPHGSATDLGSPTGLVLAAPIQKIVADPKANGYWEVAADGGVFAYGAAPFEGAASSLRLNSPIVDLVPTADGRGYWEVAADGGVFAYGDAVFAGSLGGKPQPAPTVAMAVDRATGGYWLVSADGTATAFDAPVLGPQPNTPSAERPVGPVVDVAGTTSGAGFWEVTRAGAVYAYGDAPFRGPLAPLALGAPVTTVTSDPSGSNGYWLVSADGGVFTFASAFYGAG